MDRRTLLRSGAAAGGLALLAGCGQATSTPALSRPSASPSTHDPSPRSEPDVTTSSPRSSRVLLAYFSRPGENYYYGGRRNLEVGNTEVLARRIARLIDADVFRIEAADPYSSSYDDTVARNVAEQDSNARPGIVRPPESIDSYDTVLIGSPIWNVQPPMIMATFADPYDFTGKTVLPFVTYAVSGLGRAEDFYSRACRGARVGRGLAVQGEEVAQSGSDVEAWLNAARLTS